MRMLLVLVTLLASMFLARDLVSSTEASLATKTFYGDGALKNSTVYVDGVRSGPSEQYYSDGTPEWRGVYVDGEREGEWLFWTPTGEVEAERSGLYRGGVKVD